MQFFASNDSIFEEARARETGDTLTVRMLRRKRQRQLALRTEIAIRVAQSRVVDTPTENQHPTSDTRRRGPAGT